MGKKHIIVVIIPLLIILILVIIKSSDKDNFRLDAKQIHQLSLEQNHILSLKQFREKSQSNSTIVLIDLRNQSDFKDGSLKNAVNVPFSEILENKELKKLKSTDNEIVIYSGSISESAKAWTLLTHMGYQKLFLLDIPEELISDGFSVKDSVIAGNEVLKYKFQPDTMIGLE